MQLTPSLLKSRRISVHYNRQLVSPDNDTNSVIIRRRVKKKEDINGVQAI
jgi:hypothetical protein